MFFYLLFTPNDLVLQMTQTYQMQSFPAPSQFDYLKPFLNSVFKRYLESTRWCLHFTEPFHKCPILKLNAYILWKTSKSNGNLTFLPVSVRFSTAKSLLHFTVAGRGPLNSTRHLSSQQLAGNWFRDENVNLKFSHLWLSPLIQN